MTDNGPTILAAILGACLAFFSGCGPEPAALAQATPTAAPPVAAPQSTSSPPGIDQTPDGPEAWKPSVDLRDWEFIVLHHTATDVGDVPTIHKEHRQRKDSTGAPWRGIAYHFLIGNGRGMKDGEVEPTFRWMEQTDGAHAGSLRHNEHGIGVCLVGNFNKTPPTKKQLESLKTLMTWLKQETGVPDKRVLKHSDIKTTACPGKKFTLE